MALAPIVLFVYKRIDTLKKVIGKLKNNLLANESILYIFSDGYKDNSDRYDVENVRKYIKSINGFKQVIVVEHSQNYGIEKTVINAITDIINKYGKIISLEDDIITSRYFLKYMNEALDMYENDERVGCISGYTFPIKTTKQSFFIKGSSNWGWATWKRAWNLFDSNSLELCRKIKEQNLEYEFNYFDSYDYLKMLQEMQTWDVNWLASLFLNKKLCLYFQTSLTSNIGFNTKGAVHCTDKDSRFNIKICDKYEKLEQSDVIESLEEKKKFADYICTKKSGNLLFSKTKIKNKRIITIFGFIRIKYHHCNENRYLANGNVKIYPEASILNMQGNPHNMVFGNNVHIRGNLIIHPSGGKITIGDNCYVGDHSRIWSFCSIKIGNRVLISHNVDIFDSNCHPLDPIERNEQFNCIVTAGHPYKKYNIDEKPIVIEDDVWICAKATILKGIRIGQGAIVGANSVVTQNVEPYTVVAGNPAKIVKRLK